MATEKVHLRPDVMAEPLFNRWYATAYLVAPAQAAMFVANLHLKTMRSFVSNPRLHISALKDPAMSGGPFVIYDESRVAEVKALIEKTQREGVHLLELAGAIKNLAELLANEASGYSLEPLYVKVPGPLRGCVELVYDLYNHPSFRLIENLLYASPYYQSASQSIDLSRVGRDARPCILGTPLLAEQGRLPINLPFKDERFDLLFAARTSPQRREFLEDVLDVQKEDRELFGSFFTAEAPASDGAYAGDGVRVRYFGHAAVLIEAPGISILTDPIVSYKYPCEQRRWTFEDLPPRIDLALITHSHSDHFILGTLLQLRHKINTVIVPRNNAGALQDPSLKLVLKNLGFASVKEIDEMEQVDFDGAKITGVPFLGEHADLDIRGKTAYLVEVRGRGFLFAADSNNIEPKMYELVTRSARKPDILFLGMECVGAPLTWNYGPLLTTPLPRKMDQSRRFDGSNSEKAIKLVELLGPSQVYIYAMGLEPWLTHLTSLNYSQTSPQIVESNKLIDYCRGRGLQAERLFCQKEIILSAD
jgi:L-ascorbate metabolism protein UlaG (beta-lactamase superfamily)